MIDQSDEYMTIEQAVALYPLRQEVIWVEDNISNGGALHIIVEDGNYEDGHIDYCIEHIKSGEWKKYHSDVMSDDDAIRMLDIALALKELTEQQREMVCVGECITEKAFNKLFNE